jgi:hypothetical protein
MESIANGNCEETIKVIKVHPTKNLYQYFPLVNHFFKNEIIQSSFILKPCSPRCFQGKRPLQNFTDDISRRSILRRFCISAAALGLFSLG